MIGRGVDGRVKIDSNTVERAIRPLALNRKNALFAGSDDGGDHWAVIATLIETAKLNGVNPHIWLADTLQRLAARQSSAALDQLMPWKHTPPPWRDSRGVTTALIIKLHKSQLKSDRTSCRPANPNQMRLVLHTAAYLLSWRFAAPRNP